ncbi:MAG: type II secretion system F family protein [Chloroflexota bacterium]
MKSSPSSLKHNVKNYFEEISSFDLFYQLTYMTATSAAGISRARTFQLARELPTPPAQYFRSIHEVAENLRYNYPDAVRLVGEQVKAPYTKTFLLRLSDALRSGEPLPAFLKREAQVQGENYQNDYLKSLESMKKWTDAYAAVAVSASLIVIINMVMTMIYSISPTLMAAMIFVSVASTFGVAWLIFRASPQETKFVQLERGSKMQQLSRRLFFMLVPAMFVVCALLAALGLDKGWLLILAGLFLAPIGYISGKADEDITAKDAEISSFLRSLGGNATSRGTTLKDALASMKRDSFPTLQPDIRMLDLRLKSFGKPELCWRTFGTESGSKIAEQAVGIFYEAINLGGDPERAGNLTSEFSMKTAMLRAQRIGIAATFSWLTIAMHVVMTGLMIFLIGILEQFGVKLEEAMASMGSSTEVLGTMGLQSMFSFSSAQVHFLYGLTVMLIILLSVINAFAIVASQGTHFVKMTFYLAILLVLSGVCFLAVPSMVKWVM